MILYEWQKPHAQKVLAVLKKDGIVVDASDTGTGKTYVALWAAREYGHPVLIVCPKAVIPKWTELSADAGIQPVAVMNVERLKRSKFVANFGKGSYVWVLPPGTLVIVDEAHQYGGIKTANASILYATRAAKLPVIALSATIANSPLRLRALGYLLGLFPSWYGFWPWALSHGAEEITLMNWQNGSPHPVKTVQFIPEHRVAQEGVRKIHEEIFTSGKGYRLRSGESPGFPSNRIIVERFSFDKTTEIRKIYDEIEKKVKASGSLVLSQTLALHQQIELLRLPDLSEMVQTLSEEHSVVVFLNFRESVHKLRDALGPTPASVIIGEQNETERERNRNRFQDNQTRVCLCTYGAGGLGLDLHDLRGRPRISVLTPTWSAVQLTQALGRIHRAGSLSPAVQKLIYAAGTVEEDVAKRVETSLNNLSLLQDGVLNPLKGIQV
jgi:superfamily II DNA or RNA helicase